MKFLKTILGRGFVLHVATLGAGTVFAQIIPLLASPALTRLYSPEEFGKYVALLAIAALLTAIAALRYDAALLQARYRRQTSALLAVSGICVLTVSFVASVAVVVILWLGLLPEGAYGFGYWLLAIPVLSLGNCFQTMLANINLRKKRFSDIAVAIVQKSVLLILVQVTLGLAGFGIAGLVAGSLVASFAANQRLMGGARNEIWGRRVGLRLMRLTAARFADFPKYTMPATLVNSVVLNSVVLLLGMHHSAAEIGQFGLAQRSLGAPSKVVADAFGQVLFQRLSAFERRDIVGMKRLYRKAALALTGISLVVFVPAYFVVAPLFGLIFGHDWTIAGEVAKVLTPLLAVRFVVSPLAATTQFQGLNFVGFLLQLGLLFATVISFVAAAQFQLPFLETVQLYALASAAMYVCYGIVTYARLSAKEGP